MAYIYFFLGGGRVITTVLLAEDAECWRTNIMFREKAKEILGGTD